MKNLSQSRISESKSKADFINLLDHWCVNASEYSFQYYPWTILFWGVNGLHVKEPKKMWNYELNAAVILLPLPVHPVPLMHQISKDAK